MLGGVGRNSRPESDTALPSASERRRSVRVAQIHTARLGGRQRFLGPAGCGFPCHGFV